MSGANQPFHNAASQAEKRRVLRNDRLAEPTTYHQIAVNDAEPVGGRFAQVNRTSVTGATHQYPAQPSTSFYHHDPAGQERPLGYSVDQMEPVGEAHEVAASLLGEARDGAGCSPPDAVEHALPGGEPQCSDIGTNVEPGSPLPKQRKRRRRHD